MTLAEHPSDLARPEDGPESALGADAVEPGERGLTEIADRVVEKLALRLAGEVDGVVAGGPGSGLRAALPDWLGSGSASSAQAETGRRSARLVLDIDVRYPMPAVDVSDKVRARVIEGVRSLTGLEIESLTITVRHLVAGGRNRRRVQ
jgi:uncharacterized alkaline shock family protein YloU